MQTKNKMLTMKKKQAEKDLSADLRQTQKNCVRERGGGENK
jgi:hypothetical protein